MKQRPLTREDIDRAIEMTDEANAQMKEGMARAARLRQGQTRKESVAEAVVNVFIGFVIAWIANGIAFWLFRVPFSMTQLTGITIFMTFVSVLRMYLVRRWFNWRKHG